MIEVRGQIGKQFCHAGDMRVEASVSRLGDSPAAKKMWEAMQKHWRRAGRAGRDETDVGGGKRRRLDDGAGPKDVESGKSWYTADTPPESLFVRGRLCSNGLLIHQTQLTPARQTSSRCSPRRGDRVVDEQRRRRRRGRPPHPLVRPHLEPRRRLRREPRGAPPPQGGPRRPPLRGGVPRPEPRGVLRPGPVRQGAPGRELDQAVARAGRGARRRGLRLGAGLLPRRAARSVGQPGQGEGFGVDVSRLRLDLMLAWPRILTFLPLLQCTALTQEQRQPLRGHNAEHRETSRARAVRDYEWNRVIQ